MYPARKPPRVSGAHRFAALLPRTTIVHSLILQFKRFRRVSRPMVPIFIRSIIVIFTAIELRPCPHDVNVDAPSTHAIPHKHLSILDPAVPHSLKKAISTSGTNDSTLSIVDSGSLDHSIWPLIMRLGTMTATLSAFLSIVFFDVKTFNFITIAAILLHVFVLCMQHRQKRISTVSLLAFVCFHSTSILFSTLVGRRRSITKPSVLRAKALSTKNDYLYHFKTMRHVDILEAGARAQACLLALDYSLAGSLWMSGFVLTLPFAILFLAGYGTQRNGVVLLLLLTWFAAKTENSPILGFNFTKTLSTLGSAALALSVGPGLLTVDEWIATSKQLCY